MAKITAPNKQYTGLSATVAFVNGVGETDDPHLIQWFDRNGYTAEKANSKSKEFVFETAKAGELIEYAKTLGDDFKAIAEMRAQAGADAIRKAILDKQEELKK